MTIYRLYAIEDHIITDVAVVVGDSDDEAIDYAKEWAKGRHVELREGERLVTLVPASDEGTK